MYTTIDSMVVKVDAAITKNGMGVRAACITPTTKDGVKHDLLFAKAGLEHFINQLITVLNHFDDEEKEEDPEMEMKRKIAKALGIPVEAIEAIGYVGPNEDDDDDGDVYEDEDEDDEEYAESNCSPEDIPSDEEMDALMNLILADMKRRHN